MVIVLPSRCKLIETACTCELLINVYSRSRGTDGKGNEIKPAAGHVWCQQNDGQQDMHELQTRQKFCRRTYMIHMVHIRYSTLYLLGSRRAKAEFAECDLNTFILGCDERIYALARVAFSVNKVRR